MNPTISIIVPVYNVEKYLRQCIESILNQKYQNFELILVNDGSTDSSGEICDVYSKKDNRIRVRNKENGGQSSARNIGIDLAVGKYIGFVDSDDWIDEDMYEKLMKHAIIHNSDIVACNFLVMNRKGNFKPYNNFPENQEFSRMEAMLEIYRNEILTYSPCNKIYDKRLFNKLKFVEGIILEDKDISYKLMDKSNKISYIKDSLYFYRYNKESTLRSSFSLKRIDEFKVQMDMHKYYKKKYSNVSDLIYYDLFNLGLSLYSEVINLNSNYKKKYGYLIKFDNDILKRLIQDDKLTTMQKIKVYMGAYIPSFLISIKMFQNKLRNFF